MHFLEVQSPMAHELSVEQQDRDFVAVAPARSPCAPPALQCCVDSVPLDNLTERPMNSTVCAGTSPTAVTW